MYKEDDGKEHQGKESLAQEGPEDFDQLLDPSEEPYLTKFLPAILTPSSLAPSSSSQQTLSFLCDTFQAKLVDFIDENSSAEPQSSLLSRAQYKKERRELTELEQVLTMKPSQFLAEFALSPHCHYSDLTRPVGQEFRDHVLYYLLGKVAGQVKGGVSEVQKVLKAKKYHLLPCLTELQQLPKAKNQVQLTCPKPLKMDLDFLKELIFLHLEDRVRRVAVKLSIVNMVNVKRSWILSNDPLQVKYSLYESHFLSQLKGFSSYCIQSMDIMTSWNTKMKEEFERKKAAFQKKGIPAEPILTYHGTKKQVIGTILQENFNISKAVRQAYGRGNYFSEFPEKALTYSDDQKKLILCEILPGFSYSRPNLTWPAHHSKLVKPGREGYSKMVIIEDHHQILPVAVIHLWSFLVPWY